GFAGRRELSHRANGFYSDGQRKLLAQETIDKAPTADLPPVLEAAKRDQEFPPCWQVGLPRQNISKNKTVAAQEHPAGCFDSSVAVRVLVCVEEGPPSRAVPRPGGAAAALSGSAFGINQRAQVVKAICSDEASGYQFPKRGFDLRLKFVSAPHNIR